MRHAKFSLSIILLAGLTALQAQTAPPVIQEGATAPIEPKLTYKPPGQPLKIEELAKAQRKKLEDDFYKRAGFTSVQPVVIKPAKVVNKVEKPLTRYSLSVVGIYGTTGQLQSEVYYQGKLQSIKAASNIGFFTVEKVLPNSIEVSYTKAVINPGKSKKSTPSTVKQLLRPGESLEVAV